MDELIKERHNKLKKLKRENLISISHERSLNLRKQKLEKYINDKRMLSTNSATKYEIFLEEINLSEEIKNIILHEYNNYVISL